MLRGDAVFHVVAALAPAVQHSRIGASSSRRCVRRSASAVEALSSLNWMLPLASSGRPLPSRSVQGRVSVRPSTVTGFAALATAICWPATYLAKLALMAVRPSPKRSIATPTSRRDVLPVLHGADASRSRVVLAVGALAELRAAVEPARRDLALLRLADEPVVAQTQIPGDAAHRPAILEEDAGVGLDPVAAIDRQPERAPVPGARRCR